MSSFNITASRHSKDSPISEDSLVELVKGNLNGADFDALSPSLLEQLRKKSSKHKFIVQAVELQSNEKIGVSLDIKSKSGLIWDNERDGYINIQIEINDLSFPKSKSLQTGIEDNSDPKVDALKEEDKLEEKELIKLDVSKSNLNSTDDVVRAETESNEEGQEISKVEENINKDKKIAEEKLENTMKDPAELTTDMDSHNMCKVAEDDQSATLEPDDLNTKVESETASLTQDLKSSKRLQDESTVENPDVTYNKDDNESILSSTHVEDKVDKDDLTATSNREHKSTNKNEVHNTRGEKYFLLTVYWISIN